MNVSLAGRQRTARSSRRTAAASTASGPSAADGRRPRARTTATAGSSNAQKPARVGRPSATGAGRNSARARPARCASGESGRPTATVRQPRRSASSSADRAASSRPEPDIAITTSVTPTHPGRPKPLWPSTGTGQRDPATAASASPTAAEVPVPATSTARGRPSAASESTPTSRASAADSRTWRADEATCGSMPDGSAASSRTTSSRMLSSTPASHMSCTIARPGPSGHIGAHTRIWPSARHGRVRTLSGPRTPRARPGSGGARPGARRDQAGPGRAEPGQGSRRCGHRWPGLPAERDGLVEQHHRDLVPYRERQVARRADQHRLTTEGVLAQRGVRRARTGEDLQQERVETQRPTSFFSHFSQRLLTWLLTADAGEDLIAHSGHRGMVGGLHIEPQQWFGVRRP